MAAHGSSCRCGLSGRLGTCRYHLTNPLVIHMQINPTLTGRFTNA